MSGIALTYAGTDFCPCGGGRAHPLRINGKPRAGCPSCNYTGRLPIFAALNPTPERTNDAQG